MNLQMKSLDDIKVDMSALYESLKSGDIKREDAAELANVAGKFLKAEQLQLARQIFERELLPSFGRQKQLKKLVNLSSQRK